MIIDYIDAHKERFGVEPICSVLREADVQVAPSSYYSAKRRSPSARSRSDERLTAVVRQVFLANYSCYGVRKMWRAMRRLQPGIGRDQVARLMRLAGVRGRSRSKRIITTRRGLGVERFPDLVRRRWDREALDAVWVADFTHVRTLEGTVYVSFLQDACSRRILGFTVASRKTTDLVLKAVDQAVSVRSRVNPQFTGEGVIHHADAGSQYTSLALSDKLLEHRISGSIGRIGTAYDNALMESTIGLYKTELIHADRRTWATRQEVESATVAWVSWFNRQRLHSSLDYLSPVEFEVAYNHQQDLQRQAA